MLGRIAGPTGVDRRRAKHRPTPDLRVNVGRHRAARLLPTFGIHADVNVGRRRAARLLPTFGIHVDVNVGRRAGERERPTFTRPRVPPLPTGPPFNAAVQRYSAAA
jgi:hypothetical protein